MFLSAFTIYDLGFDLTDEGWQIAKSWGIFHGDLSGNADLIWGSSFVNGIWLLFSDTPSLFWSRIAYLFFLPMIGILIYMILSQFYSKKHSFISVVISFFLFSKTLMIYPSVNYYYLPVFFSLLSFYFYTLYTRSVSPNAALLSLSGLFAGISIHTKFTFLIFIPLFAVWMYYYEQNTVKLKRQLKIFNLSLLMSILSGFFVLFALGGAQDLVYGHNRLSVFDMFSYFLGTSSVNSSLNYSASHLLAVYVKDIISSINLIVFYSLIIFIFLFTGKKFPRLKYLYSIMMAIVILVRFRHFPSELHIELVSVILSVSFLNVFLSDRPMTRDRKILFFIFLSVFALSFLGSGTGFYGGVFSFGFMGFSALTLCHSASNGSKFINTGIILPAFILIALATQLTKEYTPYRDLPSSYLNTEFKSPELKGIYSFKERADVVDEFLDFAKAADIKAKKVIFVGMPMFYFLLDVNPPISETHDVILGFEQLKKEVTEAEPEVIVMPVQSPRGQLWPLPQNADFWTRDGFERQTAHYYEFYREYLALNNFNKIFENAMFIAYRKSDFIMEGAE